MLFDIFEEVLATSQRKQGNWIINHWELFSWLTEYSAKVSFLVC